MFWTRVIISICEFLLSIILSVFVVFWSYKSFIRVNKASFDAEAEIWKGNTAVAILMASLMYAAALIMRESIYPVVSIITVALTDPSGHGILKLTIYAFGHLFFGFLLAVGCVQIALVFFKKLNRHHDEDKQIARGNTAVAVIMASVVLVIALFMKQGVSALTKSLIPRPQLGALRDIE